MDAIPLDDPASTDRDGDPAADRDDGSAVAGAPGPERALPTWMAPAWTVLRAGPRTAVVRRDFEATFRSLGLIRAADRPAPELSVRARPFRPAGGRGGLAVVPAGELGEAVVRPYRRGGLVARMATSRYLLGDRAFRELELTLRLRRAGVPAVEPLAAVQSARRPGYRAALATRYLADAAPAPEVLRGPGASRAHGHGVRSALRRMGRAARRLHDAGGHHPDLNAHNFLLPHDPDRPAVLLDFDRARKLRSAVPGPLARWSLRRLRRSLAKLGLDEALGAWDAFEEGYAGPSPRGG